jgi:hypothetical protein
LLVLAIMGLAEWKRRAREVKEPSVFEFEKQ